MNSCLAFLSYYHNESKSNIQNQFNDKSYNRSNLQIGKSFISTVPNVTKTDILAVLRDTKETSMRHLTLTAYKSRNSGQLYVLRCIYLTTTIPTLTTLGVEIIVVLIECKKSKGKKTSAKVYGLAWNRGKAKGTLGYNAVPVCTWDRDYVCMEEDYST